MINRMARRRSRFGAAAAVAAATTLAAGCAAGGSAAKSSDQDLNSQLPASIRTAGVLRIASDPTYAPVEFKDPGGKIIGLDPDIAQAIGQHLGVRVEFVETGFDKLVSGLQIRQYDAVMSAMTDNRQRREGTDDTGKQIAGGVDFVDYFIAGSSMLVANGNPQGVNGLDDLCGHTVAAQKGTTQASIVQRQQGACEKVRKPLTLRLTDTDQEAVTLVASGKAAADLEDYPVAAYAAQQSNGQFQVVGGQLQPSPYGIAVGKENPQLRDVLVKALNQVIRSGEYDTIMQKWNVGAGAAQNAVVNGGL